MGVLAANSGSRLSIRHVALVSSVTLGALGCSSAGQPAAARLSEFDGTWEGIMVCGTCPGCLGPLEKRTSVQISRGAFTLEPDRTYYGIGEIDSSGTVQVRVAPESEPWGGWTRHRNFWFNGSYTDGKIELRGERGERSCELSLWRKESLTHKLHQLHLTQVQPFANPEEIQ